ncbi:NmrA family NAD(P)-binding protein [Actinomadura litoris]|uniref:NAD(P)H-binding protein n=1 Tax=Actinomadura litoris TaxID=2678616 RepID=A0A7K1L9P2_9ACTN|nr:NAD(P)H-binding protein [Actinomadura litoris]MUN41141.1 NAD(P)H-binding protein [Actinomadura litoris]
MYLVIGATAHFGRQTVEALHAEGHGVRALTRTPEKAALPEGVEVVQADLTVPRTLPAALDGVTAAFLVLQYGMDATALVEAAAEAGVRRIVFLSSGAVVDGADEQPDVIAAYHAGVERLIAESGMEHTFLRLLFPAINSLTFGMQLQGGDVVRAPYTRASFSAIHERDVADVAVRALVDEGHAGEVYDLTGPEALTQADQVAILAETLGRPLVAEDLDPEATRKQMARFMDGAFLDALFAMMAKAVDRPAEVNDVVRRIAGHPGRTYRQWTLDHAPDFS